MAKKKENKPKTKAVKPRRRPGPPKGVSNNPAGRPKGSKNRISYDIRKEIYERISDDKFLTGLFDDIKNVEDYDKRAKLKLELVKMFVPRPMNEDEEKDRDIKSAIYDHLSGTKEKEE